MPTATGFGLHDPRRRGDQVHLDALSVLAFQTDSRSRTFRLRCDATTDALSRIALLA